jgi:hypothetical protein
VTVRESAPENGLGKEIPLVELAADPDAELEGLVLLGWE